MAYARNFMEAEMPFVVSTVPGKDDPQKRKLIRRHVMLGKNKGKSRPTTIRKPLPWEVVLELDSIDLEGSSPIRNSTFPAIPRRVGTDWSFTELAGEIEPSALADILHCKSYPVQRLDA